VAALPGGRWAGMSLRLRITTLVTAVTLVCLLGLAMVAGRGLGPLLTHAVDDELQAELSSATRAVAAGSTPATPDGLEVRVLDTAGSSVGGSADDGPPPDLTRDEVRTLKAGIPTTTGGSGPVRWHGGVVTAPDGSQRLVAVGAGLVGQRAAEASGSRWLLVTALVGTVVAGVAIWFAVGSALRPVARLRQSVRRLAPGSRVEVPDAAAGELRALADDFNALLDQQDAVAERLRRFTGDAAHELRSPVASIRLQSEVAVANPDPELSQEVHADVLADAERLSALLDGLLALARSDAGELPPADTVDLVGEVQAAVERAGEQSAPIVVSAMTNRAWAAAAHTEIELVLDNLLRNACRYTRTRVVVSVLANRSTVRVLVDDDGPGVQPEHRTRVFDRFYRASDDRARSSGGAGLGLALVAELVRRRGGRVAVGESPDGGARFTVVWPRAA
jgi:signal transduction histidine kinase